MELRDDNLLSEPISINEINIIDVVSSRFNYDKMGNVEVILPTTTAKQAWRVYGMLTIMNKLVTLI